jgi:UPF0271 protein
MRIDLNCDCGESFGSWQMGDDTALLTHVTSANVACGGHAGDPLVMLKTVRLARALGVSVGAHPGYPDLAGFGRRVIPMTSDEIMTAMLAQIGALYGIAQAEQVHLTHVKPHGALYNQAATDATIADTIASAVAAFSRELILVGPAGSALIDAGQAHGLVVAREAFADRTYEQDGTLRARSLPNAMIEDDDQSFAQVLNIAINNVVVSHDGAKVPIVADTICLHSDTPRAAQRAAFLRSKLRDVGIDVVPLKGIM